MKGQTMSTNISNEIRQLPIYLDAFATGHDAGLVMALTAITAERVRQEQMAADPGSEACRQYADGCLVSVSKQIAARFRSQEAHR
jgi:hypothetical protein